MSFTAHPYADKFPMLPESELQELAESIRENGLRHPVVITADGLILDGRNRAAACDLIGITPETVIYEGDDLAEYVIDSNITRRNMTQGARAMATALVLAADGKRDGGRWAQGALGSKNLRTASIKAQIAQAGVVLDWLPDIAKNVADGLLGLDLAYEQAKKARDKVDAEKQRAAIEASRKREATIREREENDRKLGVLTEEKSPYLTKVRSEEMSIAAAYAAHMADTEKQRQLERDLDRTRRDMCRTVAESVRYLGGGRKSATTFLREAYPHEAKHIHPEIQLTRTNIDAAIEYLETVKGSVKQ